MRGLVAFVLVLFSYLYAGAQGFTVKDYHVEVMIHQAGYFDVIEKYEVDFTESKHGLIREIITDYQLQAADGKVEKRELFIKNVQVPGHKFSKNYEFAQRLDGKLVLKIGDEDEWVRGLQTYEIRYRVYNAFLFEDGVVQFYWSLKPPDWLTVFEQISFEIKLPPGATISAQNAFVYAGAVGTSSVSSDFDYTYGDHVFSGQSKAQFFSLPGQDVTALIKLPEQLIQQQLLSRSPWQKYGWMGILILLLLLFWRVWLKYGKDDEAIAVTSYYPPTGIDPAMAGYLINDRSDTSDLIALLPKWAGDGHIHMTEIPRKSFLSKADMQLTLLKPLSSEAPAYETTLFDGLFTAGAETVLVSSLKNSFYETMSLAMTQLKKQAQHYYEAKSNRVMNLTIGLTIGLALLLCPLFLFVFGLAASIVAVLVCVFILFMSVYLQKKNKAGTEVLSTLKGFRLFVKMAEVERIKVLYEQDNQYFEKTMSYALAFGLLNEWAGKFDALQLSPPDWYRTSSGRVVGMRSFSKSFSSQITSAQSIMISKPSSSTSSGGGSSGGGFGGGGGRSW